jgi:hypothetical protein
VIGRRDDGVDVRPRQHVAVVARREEVGAPELLRARQPAVIDVGHRFQRGARDAQRGPRVAHPLTAGANQPQAHHRAIRSLGLAARFEHVAQGGRHRRGHRSGGGRLQKLAP